MDCCQGIMRYFLVGLNALFGLLGLTLMGVGGYVMVEVKKYAGVTEGSYDGVPIFIICLGLFVFLIAFLGCFGAWKKNSCLTGTYSVVLGVLVICQIGAGIAGFVMKDKLLETLEKELEKTMPNYSIDIDDKGSWKYSLEAEGWDLVHHGFDCCGIYEYTDWTNSTIVGEESNFQEFALSQGWNVSQTLHAVPSSCCKDEGGSESTCGWTYGTDNAEKALNTEGCVNKVDSWLEDNIATIAGAAVGIAVVEIVGVLFGCYLIKSENGYDSFA